MDEMRLKDALRTSEEKFRYLSESGLISIVFLDAEGKIVQANDAFMTMMGYAKDELNNVMLSSLTNEKPGSLISGYSSKPRQLEYLQKDGTKKWCLFASANIEGTDMQVGYAVEITDVLKSEAAFQKAIEKLSESEERYHKMIAEVQDYAIILLDENGIIQNWNAGAEFIKGYKADEIIGASFECFYMQSDRDSGFPKKLLAEAAKKGRVAHEGWRIRKDGTKFWGSVVITALHGDNNEIIGYSKVTRDLTSKKQSDDLALSNAIELDRKNKTLERLNEEVSSFVYVASHDLKEPLRKIRTFVSRISESESLEQTQILLGKIESSAERMQKLINDLLSYSHISNDETVTSKVDLNQIVGNVMTELELAISESKARFEIDKLPFVLGVEFQVHQLFFNLMANAIKFARAGESPVIKILFEPAHGKDIPLGLANDLKEYNKITVSDNGIGFQPDEAKTIFDVFHLLHPRTEYPGTGIGLSIVKKVMENSNGVIFAHGVPSVGATFELYFPVA